MSSLSSEAFLLFNASFLLFKVLQICIARSFLYYLFIDDISSSTPFYVVFTGFNFNLLFLISAIKSSLLGPWGAWGTWGEGVCIEEVCLGGGNVGGGGGGGGGTRFNGGGGGGGGSKFVDYEFKYGGGGGGGGGNKDSLLEL